MDRFVIRSKIVKQTEPEEPQPGPSGVSSSKRKHTESDEENVESPIASPITSSSESEGDEQTQEEKKAEELVTTKKKRKLYDVKYRKNWESEFKWLIIKSGKAYCSTCEKSLAGGKKHLKRHEDSDIHKRNTSKIRGALKIKTALENVPAHRTAENIKVAELQLIMFATEHNLPFVIFEHLPQFIRALPKPDILKNLKCSRTKATGLVNNKVGPFGQSSTAAILKETFFSIIIDETTDISTSKCLVIVVRYYCRKQEKVVDVFFGLIELETATAEVIFKAIFNLFQKYNIPVSNIIGFASDNASVMMGNLNGVKARFQNIIPNIFVIGCLSHSLHLCASKACTSLPNQIEEMARGIFNYFAHSAKRQHDFKEFQNFVDAEPHKMLRPCQTRWLSLQAVVNRILEQWVPLTLYFQSESLIENVFGANTILDNLNNIVHKLYFNFLQHILNIVSKMNLEFQSESPRIHILIPTMTMYYKMIAKFFLKVEAVNDVPINASNPSNPRNFKQLEDIYLGAGFANTLAENEHNITQHALHEIRINCLNFYIKLCTEIQNRIDFGNETLNEIAQVLDMTKIFNDDKPAISQLASKFSNIVSPDLLEDLNLEWRLLSEIKTDEVFTSIEALITVLRKQKDPRGVLLFTNLIKFFEAVISFPHGSAAAERIFSQLAMIKTRYRNSLNIATVENVLFCKQLLKNDTCYTWQPTKDLINFKK